MKKVIPVIVLVVIGIGVVGALYTQLWNPAWNPFRPIPQVVLARMALKMKGVKTLHIEGSIETESMKRTNYEYRDESRIDFNEDKYGFEFSLDIDKNNPKNQNNQLVADFESHSKSQQGDTDRSDDSSGKIEFVKIEDILYFIVTDTSKDKEDKGAQEVIFDQWIKFNRDEIGDLASLWIEEITENVSIDISKEQQDELIKELAKLFIGRKLYEIKEELPDEEISGKMTYHYSLALNEREIRRLISDIIIEVVEFVSESITISKSTSSDYFDDDFLFYLPMAAAEINMDIQGEISEFFDRMEGVDVEVWVGQRDNYLYKIQYKEEVDLVSYYEDELSKYSNQEILEAESSILVEVNFSKFDEPIEIKPPGEFRDLEEVLDRVNEERNKIKRDSQRMSDIREVRYAMDSYKRDKKKYLQSATLPSKIPTKYRLTTISEDPGNGPCSSYQWISNLNYPQQYCIWACLENGKFFAAGERGTKLLSRAPIGLMDCGMLVSMKNAPDCETYCYSPESWNPPSGKLCICEHF